MVDVDGGGCPTARRVTTWRAIHLTMSVNSASTLDSPNRAEHYAFGAFFRLRVSDTITGL